MSLPDCWNNFLKPFLICIKYSSSNIHKGFPRVKKLSTVFIHSKAAADRFLGHGHQLLTLFAALPCLQVAYLSIMMKLPTLSKIKHEPNMLVSCICT
jgi:hypothetical protein